MISTIFSPFRSFVRFCRTAIVTCAASVALLLSLGIGPALAIDKSPAPDSAEAYFITPQDGDTVAATFPVKFGLSGMGIAPAGVDIKNTGHHHLLVDRAELPDFDAPLPAGDDSVRHFGGGQTETKLMLEPGEHTLQLVLGNYAHVPHDRPVMSEPISVTVE